MNAKGGAAVLWGVCRIKENWNLAEAGSVF